VDVPTALALHGITLTTGQKLEPTDNHVRVSFGHKLAITVDCMRTVMVRPPGLTEEERAALLEDFRSKLPAEKKDKKKAPGKARELTPEEMDALHKLEEEATQPRPQDVATSSESGRLLALTMWRIPVEKGKGQKDKAHPGGAEHPKPPDSPRTTSPLLPPNAEQVGFPDAGSLPGTPRAELDVPGGRWESSPGRRPTQEPKSRKQSQSVSPRGTPRVPSQQKSRKSSTLKGASQTKDGEVAENSKLKHECRTSQGVAVFKDITFSR
jgi:hypothetical protein